MCELKLKWLLETCLESVFEAKVKAFGVSCFEASFSCFGWSEWREWNERKTKGKRLRENEKYEEGRLRDNEEIWKERIRENEEIQMKSKKDVEIQIEMIMKKRWMIEKKLKNERRQNKNPKQRKTRKYA